MSQKFWVSTGLIKIARVFYKLVLFILLCQKKSNCRSSAVFRTAIMAIIRCLSNVIIAANSVDVVWGHITLVEAQFSCMEELLKSPVKWKYYISLVGQDVPLYDNYNKQIVRALQGLNNTNNIVSSPMPEHFSLRVNFVHILKGRAVRKTTNIYTKAATTTQYFNL